MKNKYTISIQSRLLSQEKEKKRYPSYQQNLTKTWTSGSGKQWLEMIELVGLTYWADTTFCLSHQGFCCAVKDQLVCKCELISS